MSDFKNRQCKPCEGGVAPLNEDQCRHYSEMVPGWEVAADNKSIARKFEFKNFSATLSFINAMAFIAEQQDHHPDFCAGYRYCEIRFTTHAIDGLSDNDFICAAKINLLLEP